MLVNASSKDCVGSASLTVLDHKITKKMKHVHIWNEHTTFSWQ